MKQFSYHLIFEAKCGHNIMSRLYSQNSEIFTSSQIGNRFQHIGLQFAAKTTGIQSSKKNCIFFINIFDIDTHRLFNCVIFVHKFLGKSLKLARSIRNISSDDSPSMVGNSRKYLASDKTLICMEMERKIA